MSAKEEVLKELGLPADTAEDALWAALLAVIRVTRGPHYYPLPCPHPPIRPEPQRDDGFGTPFPPWRFNGTLCHGNTVNP